MNNLEWRDNHLPFSTRYDDLYYSSQNGRDETRHVFINGNRLTERWPLMQSCTIAELGFGTGLNFLETINQWDLIKPDGAQLTFVSYEQHPLSHEDIQRALRNWPDLGPHTSRLLEVWEPAEEMIDVCFRDDIRLMIIFGDANHSVSKLKLDIDAWYLDGFSPAKNPELWNETLMKQIARHTVVDGTFATYSAAGFVRRNLQEAGFNVEKIKGFGTKRDMLVGKKQDEINVADGY